MFFLDEKFQEGFTYLVAVHRYTPRSILVEQKHFSQLTPPPTGSGSGAF